MAAEGLAIGGWFASSIISNVVSSLVSYVQDLKKQLGLEEELSRLEKTLPKIQALLDAVDRGQIKEEKRALEKWLWQFRDAVDEADDFMDAMEFHRLEEEEEEEEEIHGEKSTVSPAASRFKRLKIKIKSAKTMFKRGGVHRDPTLKRLKEIVNRLDEIAAEVGVFLEMVKTSAQPPVATSTRETGSRLTVETRVFGRDKEKEMVINKLLNFNPASKKNYSILPIVGIGGIGKTTLAQFVFHDKRIDKHFSKRMWVCVSNNPDLILLTQKIYQSTLGEKTNLDNLDSLQQKISEKLESEMFLLVLDDVWDDVYKIGLEKLLAPLRSGERGSMILLTTRITGIGGMMMGKLEPLYLNGLDEGYYWEFFKECAFLDEDPECHKRLKDIGRRIAQKLHGSPLAAKTVGGILSTNLDDNYWNNILHSEIWELKQGENGIMPALRLSYQYSPSHLKPCFTFCSIFPQDYEFRKEELVYMWMALGLLQEPINGNRRPEDIGDEYLKDLVRRSFFDSRGCFYVMHDLLHELAVFVSRGECLRIEERSEPIPIPTSVRHLSITTSFALPHMPEITKLKHLRTLLLLKRPDCDVPKMLKALTSLRILESSTVEITDECISSLKHLRYLSNDGIIRPVPESVNKLYHLQFLYYKIGNPDHFPTLYPSYCINNLINLRHLSTPESRGGKFSAGIGRLSLLQNLEFNVNENGNNLFELKNLRELRELSINDLKQKRVVKWSLKPS
ncbi:putative disease resistance protein RGA4 [Typha angustifolia]|uniref:putative disease resistance protein RGA4 n=1 Tax=Typha angustifolia TaxID=59011 RepID=UPI003C2B9766